MNKTSILAHGASIILPWAKIKISGSDAVKFLQGQTTNDVLRLPVGQIQYNALVDQSGKLQSYFLLFKTSSEIICLVDETILGLTKERLEKFIITEDVELKIENAPSVIELGYASYAKAKKTQLNPHGLFWGIPGAVKLDTQPSLLKNINEEEFTSLVIQSGIPRLGKELNLGKIINESFLEKEGISYSKGCFLGQETVSKIHHFRGPAYFPMKLVSKEKPSEGFIYKDENKIGEIKSIISIGEEFHAYAYILRDYRLEGMSLDVQQENKKFNIVLSNYSYENNYDQLSNEILELASHSFTHLNDNNLAKNLLRSGIEIDPQNGDLYESLGVILGRENKFDEAIALMDELSQIDPDSVMAYTNKSLYLMKLGKIEEAEAAKATATIKSFSYYGKIAKEKELKLKQEQLALEQQQKRKGMFLQVLEIDPEDALANFGLGEICFENKEYSESINYLTKVLQVDAKYSVGYLVLGKAYEALGDLKAAEKIYREGIPIATSKGELMPANEMQSRLSKIKI